MKFLLLSLFVALAVAGTQGKFFPFGSKNENYNFEVMPNHRNYTLMARFIAHNVNWTSVALTSYEKDTYNLSTATLFSQADGPMSNGTGTPYFLVTFMEPAIKNLFDHDRRCGLMMSLATTEICAKNKWDPEDPRCSRVYMTGKLERLSNKTAEYDFAKKAYTARHPYFVGMPNFHEFFFVKYVIETIKIISSFGGVRVVPIKDYYACKDSKYNLF